MDRMGYRDAATEDAEDEPTSNVPTELEAAHLRALLEPRLRDVRTMAAIAMVYSTGLLLLVTLAMFSTGPTMPRVGIAAACATLALGAAAVWDWSGRSVAQHARDRLVSVWGDVDRRPGGWAFIADDGRAYATSPFGAHGASGRTRARVNTRLRVALLFPPHWPTLRDRASIDPSLADFRASFR